MDCEEIQAAEVVERYVLRELPEDERDAFEQHYFECDRCFAAVRAVEAIRSRLAADAATPARGLRPRQAAWMGIAAALILTAGTLWLVQRDLREPAVAPSAAPESKPPADVTIPSAAAGGEKRTTPDRASLIAELARVEPPEYVLLTMRAGEAAPLFNEAMVQYARGDFLGATMGLDAAGSRAPTSSRIQFYRGIANLMVDRPERSVAAFDRAAQGDDEAYADPARFFRAKAQLRLGDLDAAMRDLEVVARGSSEHAVASQRMLNALR